MTVATLIRTPSGFLPLAMSLAAVLLLVGWLAVHGVQRQQDEGAAARLWQLLMGGQLPVIAYFGIRWVATAPRAGLIILAIQVAAALITAAPVFILKF